MNLNKIIKESIHNLLEAEIPGYGEVPDDLHLNDYDERQKSKEMNSDWKKAEYADRKLRQKNNPNIPDANKSKEYMNFDSTQKLPKEEYRKGKDEDKYFEGDPYTTLNVLVACEASQTVCEEFRKVGCNAFSCDVQHSYGGHSKWHFLGDALSVIKAVNSGKSLKLEDGTIIEGGKIPKWDLLIAHPPCTFLTSAGQNSNYYGSYKRGEDGKMHKTKYPTGIGKNGEETFLMNQDRMTQQRGAIDLFMSFITAPVDHICVENPAGIMTKVYGPPTQYFSPYQFGEPYAKQTGLWLKNLEPIQTDVPKKEQERLYQMSYGTYSNGKKANKFMDRKIKFDDEPEDDATGALGVKNARSKFSRKVSAAMARQWGHIKPVRNGKYKPYQYADEKPFGFNNESKQNIMNLHRIVESSISNYLINEISPAMKARAFVKANKEFNDIDDNDNGIMTNAAGRRVSKAYQKEKRQRQRRTFADGLGKDLSNSTRRDVKFYSDGPGRYSGEVGYPRKGYYRHNSYADGSDGEGSSNGYEFNLRFRSFQPDDVSANDTVSDYTRAMAGYHSDLSKNKEYDDNMQYLSDMADDYDNFRNYKKDLSDWEERRKQRKFDIDNFKAKPWYKKIGKKAPEEFKEPEPNFEPKTGHYFLQTDSKPTRDEMGKLMKNHNAQKDSYGRLLKR